MSRKDFYLIGMMMIFLVMWDMNVTPQEFLYLVKHTLPNWIKYKIGM